MGGDTRATHKMRRPSQKPPSNGSHGDHKGGLQTCGGTYGNHNIYWAGGSWAGPGQGLQRILSRPDTLESSWAREDGSTCE